MTKEAKEQLEKRQAAAAKAWETIRAKKAAQAGKPVPLTVNQITKGLRVRVLAKMGNLENSGFASVLKRLNATTFRLAPEVQGQPAITAKVGEIFAA